MANDSVFDELLEEKDKESSYFAAKSAEKTAGILLDRAEDWFNTMRINGYMDKLKQMYAYYHGAYYNRLEDSHNITFSGEQGELANISINHLRNLAQNMLTLITANRPSLQARAINTDYKSLTQTTLANGLLDYYMRDKRLENFFKTAVEYALVLGTGYVKMEWNSSSGELYDYNEHTRTEIRQGDVEFSNLSPFDVVFDGNRDNDDHDWVLCRSFKNKHDIAAQYPELQDKIIELPTKNEIENAILSSVSFDETDLIPVYEFYHKRTSAMPDGRYIMFLSQDITLLDAPMPYRHLPVYPITPSKYLGTPYGYSPLFDIIGIQDAVNGAYSTILTNQSTFGTQNVVIPEGSGINVEQLPGGLNIIEVDMQNGGTPQALNLTNTPKEIFDFMAKLEQTMETLSGINAVTRGNPGSTDLTSGTALALVQSMSLQFMSGLQQSYVQMLESVGTGLIYMLKDFASVPRVAMIVGKANRPYMKEFTGEDLSSINRVIVDVANPLSRTTAGRIQMAEQLLQMGAIKTPEEYFTVINTGVLDSVTEDTQREMYLIRAENERLVDGADVRAMVTDEHATHIREHKYVLSDPDLRFNPELSARVTAHIQEHIDLLRGTDPDLLAVMGQQPLGPEGGSPANQPEPQGADVDVQNVPPNEMVGDPNIAQQMSAQDVRQPKLPTPPAPFENAPVLATEVLPQG